MISISWPISRGFTYLLIVGVEGEIHPFCTIVIFKLSENSDFFFSYNYFCGFRPRGEK